MKRNTRNSKFETKKSKAESRTRSRGFRAVRFSFRFSLFLCAVGLMATAQTHAQVLTLDTVMAIIDRNNPMLEEYENRAQALDEYSKGASSWMAPMVGVGTFMTPYPNQMLMEEGDKGAWMFSIEQEIPNPAKVKANRNYLRSRGSVEKEGRNIQLNNLRAEARTYYYQSLVAQERLKLLRENERIMDLMLKLARIRYPYNQGSLGNIYKAEGRLGEIQNMIMMTNADIDSYATRLKALMALPPSDSIMVDTATVVDFEADRIIYDTAALSERLSEIRQIDQQIEVMRLNQQLQASQSNPDFKIRFDHMQPVGNMPSQFTAMGMISIPIAPWSSKMYKAEVKGMQYDIQAMQEGREAILIETRGMLAAMASQLLRMEQQLANYKNKIIPALRKNYQTLMLAYEENREQLPIVIDGWEAMNMAQMDHLDKMQAYYLMVVSYEKELER